MSYLQLRVVIPPVNQLYYFSDLISQHTPKILVFHYSLLVPDQVTHDSDHVHTNLSMVLLPSRMPLPFSLQSLIMFKELILMPHLPLIFPHHKYKYDLM